MMSPTTRVASEAPAMCLMVALAVMKGAVELTATSHPSTKNIEVVEDDDVNVDGMGGTNDVDGMPNVSDAKT
ncbi:hypothetical protein PC114_g8706 [Phytophthora cactorum]|nr:hypothetical protein PC114_g8706 [Phytophthora cactorum]